MFTAILLGLGLDPIIDEDIKEKFKFKVEPQTKFYPKIFTAFLTRNLVKEWMSKEKHDRLPCKITRGNWAVIGCSRTWRWHIAKQFSKFWRIGINWKKSNVAALIQRQRTLVVGKEQQSGWSNYLEYRYFIFHVATTESESPDVFYLAYGSISTTV